MGKIRETREDIGDALKMGKELLPFFDRYAPKGRRLLYIAVLFITFVCSPAYGLVVSSIKEIHWSQLGVWWSNPYPCLVHFIWSGHLLALLSFVACMVFSYFFCVCLTIFIKSVAYRSPERKNALTLLNQLIYRLGIRALFPTDQMETIARQDYAPWMTSSVSNSKQVRLLSIAAYEYVGKGNDSLLYSAILNHPEMSLRVILLNPRTEQGKLAIKERVKELELRDSSITPELITTHIESTIATLKQLSKIRQGNGHIEVRQCTWHPIFRLVLCDREVFFSAYGNAMHGHESPVIQIQKRSPDGSASDTLYHSWDKYFESIWDNSEPIKF